MSAAEYFLHAHYTVELHHQPGTPKLKRRALADQFLAQQLAYFLQRLKDTPEGDGNLLDSTLVLYGSSNSKTHNNTNYPTVLAGGRKLGFKHNQFIKFDSKTPFSNLFVTMMDKFGAPIEKFADSTGEMTELLA